MAHLDKIDPALLERVAREIAEFIDRGSERKSKEHQDAGETPLELGETLTIWKFQARTFEALAQSKVSGDLSEWLEQTPLLYHQIRLRGKPAGFARSRGSEGKGEKALFQLNASPLALELHQFFERIDRNEQDDPFLTNDPVVRLLEIPPFQVSALWLFLESQGESRALIIYAPKRYKELYEGAMVNSKQFFDALSIGPISDITESNDEGPDKSGPSPDQKKIQEDTPVGKVRNRMAAKHGVRGRMGDVSGSRVRGRMGDVSGRMGDVSGRMGDVSGRMGDVSGRMGDVSGLPVEGRIGDVPGSATFEEVEDLVLRDRNVGNLGCLEARVDRLEYEVLAIARWLNLRMRALEDNMMINFQHLEGVLNGLSGDLSVQTDTVDNHEERIADLEDENGDES